MLAYYTANGDEPYFDGTPRVQLTGLGSRCKSATGPSGFRCSATSVSRAAAAGCAFLDDR